MRHKRPTPSQCLMSTTTAGPCSVACAADTTSSRYDTWCLLQRDVCLPAPMGLKQDTVDLFEVDDFSSVADGLEQRAETRVLGAA